MNRVRRIWYRIGRRGATLLFLGLLDVLIGYSLIRAPAAEFHGINYMFPYPVWGWIWLGVGVVCLLSSPLRHDRMAYATASAIKTGWGLVNGYAWIKQDIPRGWVSAVIWIAFAGLVLIISSWPESVAIYRARAQIDDGGLWTLER